MERPKLFVSVDVDSLALYLGLYGRVVTDEAGLTRLTWELGVRRFLDLFRTVGVRGVFFVVGRDLGLPAVEAMAAEVRRGGHGLGNHTWSHPYDLIRLSTEAATEEITRGHDVILGLTESSPRVFRAPGYNLSRREYRILADLGCRYDASPLPSWPYLVAKYSVMAGLRVRGRRSRSIVGNPWMGLSSRRPYFREGVCVLPCAVTPWLRLPVIGTTISTLPLWVVERMLGAMQRQRFVSLEFHAADLLELEGDRLPMGLEVQKDLLIPLEAKLERYRWFLGALAGTHRCWIPGDREEAVEPA